MKTFQTIKEAANFIGSHANTGKEITLNDCLFFGMGLVYAYKEECEKAGILTAEDGSAFHHLSASELYDLLTWLFVNDGYLIAA